jgi:hypothetical protein
MYGVWVGCPLVARVLSIQRGTVNVTSSNARIRGVFLGAVPADKYIPTVRAYEIALDYGPSRRGNSTGSNPLVETRED